ncbi:Hsp70 family protein [Corynebacterium sp. YSMAA1_1_F7]|uniref:Hsp70 family protein n=1 Tax=Corynebacterium sp. YSMAA1_1_F7 TaxID=3383590 RepID=UPI0038D11CE4
MNNAWHLAVDFGTSNTAAAHQSPMGREISALALTHRSNIMPSAVFLDAPHGTHAANDEDPTLLNGDSALARGRRDPSRLLLSPKRYIDHDEVQLAGRSLPLTKVVGSVLATVLRSGKAQHANQDPETVTLTHPEAWSAHSVEQLKRSAIAAGVQEQKIRVLSEPRAAAIHYASQQSVQAGSHVAVFDFGGGTLDIAVLRAKQDGNFEVVAAKGDNSLGGRTIDNLLYRWVLDQLEHDDPDLADYVRSAPITTVHALESSIREAKEILSDTSSATISVSTPHGETDLLITRDEFNNVIEQSIMRGVELTRAALTQAGVDSTNTPIYMTGGSSRIPFVQDRLGEIGTVMTLDDPKTVVSRGALAATLRGFTGDAPIQGSRGQGAARQNVPGPRTTGQPPRPNGIAAGAGAAGAAGAGAAGAAGAVGYGTGAASAASRPSPSTQSFNNQPQTSAFVPSSGNAYGASSFSGASASSSAKPKKSNTPVIVTAALAVLAVVVAIGFVVSNTGGDNGGNGGDDGGNPPFTEANPYTPSTTPYETEKYKTVGALIPEIKDYAPSGFYNRLTSCNTKPDSPAFASAAYSDVNVNMYSCLPDYNSLGDHNDDFVYSNFRYVASGDDAQKVYDHGKNSGRKIETLQEAGNGWPEITYHPGEDFDRAGTTVWYPDHKLIVLSSNNQEETKEDAIEMLKFYGLMPQN